MAHVSGCVLGLGPVLTPAELACRVLSRPACPHGLLKRVLPAVSSPLARGLGEPPALVDQFPVVRVRGLSETGAQLCPSPSPAVRGRRGNHSEERLFFSFHRRNQVRENLRMFRNKCCSRIRSSAVCRGRWWRNPSPRGLARCPGTVPASRSLSWHFLLCQALHSQHGRARRPAAGVLSWQPLPRAHQSLGPVCEEGTASRNPALGSQCNARLPGTCFLHPLSRDWRGPEHRGSRQRRGGGMCMRLLHLGPLPGSKEMC